MATIREVQDPIFTISLLEKTVLRHASSSNLIKKEENTSNDYVTKTAKRYDSNIHEAITETLATINVQIAVWVAMATFIDKFRGYVKAGISNSSGLNNNFYDFT